MRILIAWRILAHEKARSALAVMGVFAAVVLVFLQLGFYSSVPIGATFIYDAMEYDVALSSRDYSYQIRTGTFPRSRLAQALAVPEVESAYPFYQRFGRWLNVSSRRPREIFIMGFNPDHLIFNEPTLRDQAWKLKRPYTALLDDSTSPAFGGRDEANSSIELNDRVLEIVGEYRLGTGFLGRGAVAMSDLNFSRIVRDQKLDDVHVGLIRLKSGADAAMVVEQLNALLPPDTRALTREDFRARERSYWTRVTSTGLVFGFGTIVAGIIGATILFQTLATLILRNLKEYAVLKAMGYSQSYLVGIVVAQAVLFPVVAFGPAVAAAYGLYGVARDATFLSIYMTDTRIVAVFAATLAVSVSGALLSIRLLKRADPADLF